MGVRLIQCSQVEWTDADGVLHTNLHGEAIDLPPAEEERLDALGEMVLAPPGATLATVEQTAEEVRAEWLAYNTGHGPKPRERGPKSWH
jgi:hypothetical protein